MARDRFVVGFPLGRWQTNCYVVGDRGLGTAVVIDPGEDGAARVPEILERNDVTCEAVLLTHAHLDHLWGAPELARSLDVPVALHPEDRWLWDDPAAGFGSIPPGALEQFIGGPWEPPTELLEDLADGARLTRAGMTFEVRHSPGHTPGHCTFLVADVGGVEVRFGQPTGAPEPGVLFSGDLVFRGSVGRTDFPRGSWDQQLASIGRTFLPLDDDTLVLSGHGPETTVGRERRTNPFLAEIRHTGTSG